MSNAERHARLQDLEQPEGPWTPKKEEHFLARNPSRELTALSERILARCTQIFPDSDWTDAESAIDLMVAEITTLRSEVERMKVDFRSDMEKVVNGSSEYLSRMIRDRDRLYRATTATRDALRQLQDQLAGVPDALRAISIADDALGSIPSAARPASSGVESPPDDGKCLCYGRGCNRCEPQGRG